MRDGAVTPARVLLASVLLSSAMLASCVPARNIGSDGGPSGCTGLCSSDGGVPSPDGGLPSATDAGADAGGPLCEDIALGTDAGVVSVEQLRALPPCGQHVRVELARVVAVDRAQDGTNVHAGANAVDFWVASPDGGAGFYVRKAYEDAPRLLAVDAGDLLAIDGYLAQVPAVTSASDDGINYRPYVGALPNAQDGGALTLALLDAGPPVDPVVVDAGEFGNAEQGAAQPNPELAGLPIRVNGPLQITRWNPPALAVETPSGTAFRGFEVEGGILVIDDRVREGCDLRALADGGAWVLPAGVGGIWDTDSHGPCLGTDVYGTFCGDKDAGTVPGVPGSRYTYALQALGCDDLVDAGDVDAGP